MELQFYGPGYVPQFEGFGCAKTQYCAAMTIDSFVQNQNTGVANTSACNNYVLGGPEPINWAYITKSGKSQAPANPLFTGTLTNPNFAAVNPDLRKDLLMSPGDVVRFRIHDTRAGLRIDMADLTTGQHGSTDRVRGQRLRPSFTGRSPRRARRSRTRSTRSTRRPTRAATPGRRTRTTWPCPMRSGISRTAWPSTTRAIAPRRAARTPSSTPTTLIGPSVPGTRPRYW